MSNVGLQVLNLPVNSVPKESYHRNAKNQYASFPLNPSGISRIVARNQFLIWINTKSLKQA
jgi:hypothetical protein